MASTPPLTEAELDDLLDYLLGPVLSSRRTATPLARLLAPMARHLQDFVLHWIEVIDRTNYELAYQFAAAAPQGLARLDLATAEAWIIEAMDTYDREGLYRGSAVFKDVDKFATRPGDTAATVQFTDVSQVLQLFICGLSGRRLALDTAPHSHTDTATLFLPPHIAVRASKEENFFIYKMIATLLWAQGRFGTFTVDLDAVCAAYDDPARALALLNILETVRLEACIARELPGLARDMRKLRDGRTDDPRCARLAAAAATVSDSIALLEQVYADMTPAHPGYLPVLLPEQAAAVQSARMAKEKSEFQSALARLLEEKNSCSPPYAPSAERFTLQASGQPDELGDDSPALMLDGKPVTPVAHVSQLMDSILQDLGEIPDDYLHAAGDDGFRQTGRDRQDPADDWKGVNPAHGEFFYNEWDSRRRHYRKNWCSLRELDVHPGSADFTAETLAKYAPQVTQLKRMFELLRGEDKLLKKQPYGDDIDLDAVIAAYADMKSGMELSERLLVKRHKTERDLAVMLMVDMSGSTKGWINDAEREALAMLCEALEVLGDRYAIYGFSGITRKRCEIFRVKRFDESYGELVKSRIAGIQPQDYTRMGVAIRHLTTLLNQVEARTKLLITLSDGKPDDYSDHYRGEYGIEDTRQALIEAHRSGIKPFCITIDREARDYLPHMYGQVNWTLVDDVARLPLKVADIYRRLTT